MEILGFSQIDTCTVLLKYSEYMILNFLYKNRKRPKLMWRANSSSFQDSLGSLFEFGQCCAIVFQSKGHFYFSRGTEWRGWSLSCCLMQDELYHKDNVLQSSSSFFLYYYYFHSVSLYVIINLCLDHYGNILIIFLTPLSAKHCS